MQTVQSGDRVEVHYVKRFQDGSVVSSHSRMPLELTVGVAHPRLPGLAPVTDELFVQISQPPAD